MARRSYAALLVACRSDLANAHAVAMRIEEQVSDGIPVLDLDAPGLFAQRADAKFYNEGTYRFMRPLIAHCHRGLGTLSRGTAGRAEATEHLATAARMYREMGMELWLEQVEPESRDRGA